MKKLTLTQIYQSATGLIILAMTLFWLLFALPGCAKLDKTLPPWTVVCDKSGHFTNTWWNGEVNDLRECTTRDEAIEMTALLKAAYESDRSGAVKTPEETERQKIIASRHWEVCSEASKQGAPTDAGQIMKSSETQSGSDKIQLAEKRIDDMTGVFTGVDASAINFKTTEASTSIIFARHNSAWLTVSPIKVPEGVHWDGRTGVYYREHTKLLLTVEPVVRKTADGWEITFKAEGKK